MISLYVGAKVTVQTADNRRLPFRALSGVVDGHDFPVVWVCSEHEWEMANREQRSANGLPWPVEAVEVAENAKNTR
jgi:hypothetical protein